MMDGDERERVSECEAAVQQEGTAGEGTQRERGQQGRRGTGQMRKDQNMKTEMKATVKL